MSRESRLTKTQDMARAGLLEAPEAFKQANLYELKLVCNGCGAADAKIDAVPDKIYGTYVGYACFIHDWRYNEGETEEDKKVADKEFRDNLFRIIKLEDKWYKPTFLMRRRALKYYWAVKYLGDKPYWKGKSRPKPSK